MPHDLQSGAGLQIAGAVSHPDCLQHLPLSLGAHTFPARQKARFLSTACCAPKGRALIRHHTASQMPGETYRFNRTGLNLR